MTQVFTLSYDPISPSPSGPQLQAFIKEHRLIEEWYQPFLGTYIFKSSQSAATLKASFDPMFASTAYLISIAQPAQMTGALPPSIWAWISRGQDFLSWLSSPPPPPPK